MEDHYLVTVMNKELVNVAIEVALVVLAPWLVLKLYGSYCVAASLLRLLFLRDGSKTSSSGYLSTENPI